MKLAPGRRTQLPFSQISGTVTTREAVSRPATVTIRPSASIVTVGYQRPSAILGSPVAQLWLTGSKMLVTRSPRSSP